MIAGSGGLPLNVFPPSGGLGQTTQQRPSDPPVQSDPWSSGATGGGLPALPAPGTPGQPALPPGAPGAKLPGTPTYSEFQCPKRPNHGMDGRPILLRANHFQVRLFPTWCVSFSTVFNYQQPSHFRFRFESPKDIFITMTSVFSQTSAHAESIGKFLLVRSFRITVEGGRILKV